MARNHCAEKRFTFARQYPKGIFRINTAMLMIRSKLIIHINAKSRVSVQIYQTNPVGIPE